MADLDLSKLTGLVKKIYADTYVNAIPEWAWFLKNVKFQSAKKLGDTYEQMVVLASSHGITYGGTTGAAYSLATPIPMQTYNASVKGYEYTLREILSIGAIKRAMGTKEAFADLWTLAYEQMMAALTSRLEMSFLDGGNGIGVCASSVNASGTTTNVTMNLAEWAPGIWSGIEGASVSFYTSNTTLVSSAADSVFTVTSVNPSTRVVLITGTATGISALDTAIGSNPNAVNVYFSGILGTTPLSSFGAEPTSVRTAIANTGTLWNINGATFGLWKGNNYSAGSAAFNFGKATAAVSQVVARTGAKGEYTFLVNPRTWNSLNANEAANRRYDQSYDKGRIENGTEQITYWGQSGKITFEPHIYVKEGFAYGLFNAKDPSVWRRVGSTEITNEFQGTSEMLVLSSDKNGVETRLYTDQAPFCSQVSKQILVSGIVN